MSDAPILPGARAAFVNPDGTPSRPFYDYLRRQSLVSNSGTASNAQLSADIVTLAKKLGADDGLPGSVTLPLVKFQGFSSLFASQTDNLVSLSLQGDVNQPGNTYFYGTTATGGKGWRTIYSALAHTVDTTLSAATDGTVTIGLADLADSGAGSLLAITRDAKGRITGTRDATITGTAGRVTVANGSAAAGVPTLDLAAVADAGGGALLRFVRDAWGRITGTSAATTADLAEGSNLYYTDARADARITAQKGVANGLAPLASDGKISTTYLPAAVLGQVSYQGTWDASAGTAPTSTPSKGWYYIVTVAGSTNLSGITDWKVGDWAIYNGTAWNKVDNTDAIASWNGRTGAVVPQAGDYTAALVGAEPAITAGTTTQYWRGDKGWRDFATDVRAAVLTGLSTATNAVIAATDTVLGALGKLQAQITGNAAIPAGYIDGLKMVWNSGTSLSVTSGNAYIQGSSAVVSSPSTLTLSALSLAASTWYHVYLYLNAGVPAIECVTTAPAAAYSGTARSKTGDTSRRYVGSVLTNASGGVVCFSQQNTRVFYLISTTSSVPFRVLSNGIATTQTIVACAAVIPITASAGLMRLQNNSNVAANFGPGIPFSTIITSIPPQPNTASPGMVTMLDVALGSDQSMVYFLSATSTTSGMYIDTLGYIFER